ncbi:unnamed protein product [Adineta steineri]|uniref:Uncharacterized protein n=1 Tax=Adineta steineri TaxID=433720 RepID=A0A818UHW4_9BILA|nr:unnamed protein product [Adineta steineri]CAF3698811.1 unnamed protein product [Adineta steineri]
MIHSDDESILEDYWYSDEKCSISSGERYPCEEIYFTKNTDIPLKTVRIDNFQERIQTEYKVLSIGKPDEKLFEPIPLDWAYKCNDLALGVVLNATTLELKVNESATIEIYLSTPPHRINGNDTVIIEYKPSIYSVCPKCVRLVPKRLVFNSDNFRHPQKLIVTRIKASDAIWIDPTFIGGAYEQVMASLYNIRLARSI